MPRISADTVAEHVAHQERAVFDAALGLFVERGYGAVTLADIAAEVGLARNSLYRYFPGKAHILARWLRRELAEQAERSRALLSGDGPAGDRIAAWVVAQMDYARRPEHRLVAALPEVVDALGADTRAELAGIHHEIIAPLDGALIDAGIRDATHRAAIVELIGALVLAGADRESRTAADRELRAHVLRAVAALVEAPA